MSNFRRSNIQHENLQIKFAGYSKCSMLDPCWIFNIQGMLDFENQGICLFHWTSSYQSQPLRTRPGYWALTPVNPKLESAGALPFPFPFLLSSCAELWFRSITVQPLLSFLESSHCRHSQSSRHSRFPDSW